MSINKDSRPSQTRAPENVSPNEAASGEQQTESEGEAWAASNVERMIFGPRKAGRKVLAIPETGARAPKAFDDEWRSDSGKESKAEPSVETSASTNEPPAKETISRVEHARALLHGSFEIISAPLAIAREPKFLNIALPVLGGLGIAILTAVIMRYV